jgi:tetratricopeptide (TPR) repeat protein
VGATLAIFVGLAAISGLLPRPAFAQKPAKPSATSRAVTKQVSPESAAPTPVALELQKRTKAAVAARETGDPEAVERANERLLAFALRQMGHLRLVETAFPEAIELYRRSLVFEDTPDTRIDLAIAYLSSDRRDDAIAETTKALAADPKNARGWAVQGKAWMKKQDPSKAAESLLRSVEIQPDIDVAYSLGVSLLAAKQTAQAEVVFHNMVEMAGDSGALHVLFARAYRDADMLDDTVRELKKAIALDTTTPHAHYFLGLSYLTLNMWAPTPQCREEFLEEVRYHPRDYLSNYFLGVISSIGQQYEESNHYLKVATDINPSAPHPWLYLGLNAYAQKNNALSEKYLRQAILLSKGQEAEANYLIRKGYVVLGRILVTSGRREEGEAYLAKARELQNSALAESTKDVKEIQAQIGMGSAAMSPDPEPQVVTGTAQADPTAQIDSSTLVRANLTDAEKQGAAAQDKQLREVLGSAFNDLATSEAVRRQFDLALGHYLEAERWHPGIPGLARNTGTAAFRVGNYAEAVQALSKALATDPADKQSRAMLGMAYYATEAYASAARTITPLGEAALHDPGLGYTWAASLTRTGDLNEATRVLNEVEKGTLSTDTLLLVGRLWTDIGDYAHAVTTFHRALQADPSLPKAHFYSGLAQLQGDHFADAASEFQAELAVAPGDLDAKYNLGFAYLQQSRREEAATIFREVIAADPRQANAHFQLGKILLDEGNIQEAVPHLEEAARLNPEADYVHFQLQTAYRKEARIEDADRELQLYRETKARNRQRDLPKPAENAGTPTQSVNR